MMSSERAPVGDWHLASKDIHGWLCDITGVLYDSGAGGGTAIPGSIEAIARYTSLLHVLQHHTVSLFLSIARWLIEADFIILHYSKP